jgi:PAS domain S-box-containing protein
VALSLFRRSGPEPADLQSWREQTLRVMGLGLLMLFVPFFPLHAYGSLQRQEYTKLAFEIVVCTLIVGVPFAKPLPYRARVSILLSFLYLLAAELIFTLGLAGPGRVIFCVIPLLTAMLLGRRAAIISWVAAMTALGTLLFVIGAGLIDPPLDTLARLTDPNALLVNGLVVMAFSGISVAVIISLMGRLAGSVRAAEEANSALALMLRMLPDIVWFKDAEGRYKFASDAFFAFHSRSREELIGRPAAEVFPPELAAMIERGDRQVIELGRPYFTESRPPRPVQPAIWLDTFKTPVYDEEGRLLGILGISHDITARKQAEAALARQARYAEALASCAQLLLGRGESQWGRMADAIEQLRAAIGVSRFFVYCYQTTPGAPTALIAETLPPEEGPYEGRRLQWDEIPPEFHDALRERRWFGGPTAGRWPDYPAFQALFDDNGITSTLVVPLYVDGRLWGHMGLSDRAEAREWDDATVQLLFTAAEMLAASIAGWEDAQALRERTAAAEAADRAKSDFLAIMSHEIRTPLNAVVGTAELLAGTPLGPGQRELAELIRGGGEALLKLVNSILDFSKLEAGRLDPEQRPFDLHACLEGALDLVAGQAVQKELALGLRRAPELPRYVVGDVTLLRRVLINLLANAVKFTEQGSVTLEVDTGALPDHEQPCVRFVVRDTGIGIPPDRLAIIFDPFTQADSSTTRRYGGTGLGLAICKQLVELMGGRIEVESAVGTGSSFTVLLPLPASEAPAAAEARPESGPGAHARRLRVLVAEDNAVNQEVTTLMLASLGYSAQIVPDGAAAVAAVAGRPYDVVLMDVQMPGVDGIEATRRIRAMGGRIHQPRIVAVTANAMRDDRERYLAAGMDDYLDKPVRLAALQAALARVPGETGWDGEAAGCGEAAVAEELVDWQAHGAQVELFGDDAAAEELVLQLLAEEIGGQIAGLVRAVEEGASGAIEAAAHKLRGSCAQLGAQALAKRCAAIEHSAAAAPLEALAAEVAALRECHAETLRAVRAAGRR